jgi:hypothetical protein
MAKTQRLRGGRADGCACFAQRAPLSYTDDLARHVQDKPCRDGAYDKLGWSAHLEEEQRWDHADGEASHQIGVREHIHAEHAEGAVEGIRDHLQ